MGFHSLSKLGIVYSVQCVATGFPSPPISGGAQLCQVSARLIICHSYQKLGSDEAGGGQRWTGQWPSTKIECRSLLPTANRGCQVAACPRGDHLCPHCLPRLVPPPTGRARSVASWFSLEVARQHAHICIIGSTSTRWGCFVRVSRSAVSPSLFLHDHWSHHAAALGLVRPTG